MLGIEQHRAGSRIRVSAADFSVAELAIVVASPCPCVPILVDCQRMKIPGADLDSFEHRARMLGIEQHRLGGVSAAGFSVAELAVVVVSPCPYVPILVDCQRKQPSGAHLYGFQPRINVGSCGRIAYAHGSS